jgi:hypothetical protein
MKRIAVLWAFAFGFLPLAQAQVNGVTAELSLAQKELLAGEDMEVTVRIANRSGQDIFLGKEKDWITFAMTGEKNAAVAPLGEMPVTGEFSLHSAQAGKPKFNLTPYFNFRNPGIYTVSATIKIAQWNRAITCKPVAFNIVNGIRLANIPDLQVGLPLPAGATNTAPEVRKYFLQKVSLASGMKLYFQLTDETGSRTLRTFPIGQMTSFSEPEAQIDRFSNLHVLHQTGARSFNYCVINPLGQILDRQTWEYTDSRPVLRGDAEGGIVVGGGARKFSASDLPPGIQGPGSSVPSIDINLVP